MPPPTGHVHQVYSFQFLSHTQSQHLSMIPLLHSHDGACGVRKKNLFISKAFDFDLEKEVLQ
jgi:hypothetical protein